MRWVASRLPEEGRALVVSHGGVVELGVVGLLPDLDYSTWGPSCKRGESVRLYFEGDRCVNAEIRRRKDLVAPD
jgi:hypothetical protein